MTAQEMRDAGFMPECVDNPRDEVALRLLCAFNGVDWKVAPPAWWYYPNPSIREAWQRVADEARAIFQELRLKGVL